MTEPEQPTRCVELHTHSTASDGTYAPDRLAEMMVERGVELWALTDHDNCDGCASAARAADERGLEFMPGIEISAYRERSIHVLGLGVDPDSEAIVDLSERLYEARRSRMREMVEQLEQHGVEIGFEAVTSRADGSPLSRAHLAAALVEEGPVETKDRAFDRYIGADAPAYVPVGWPSVPRATEAIHDAGGAAVLAHPGRYDVELDIREWVAAGLDGLEVAHPDHSDTDERHLRRLADELGVLATRGSDFHGRPGDPRRPLGEVEMQTSMVECLRAVVDSHR